MALAGWIMDLDGVVYRGSEGLPGAVDFFERARRRGDAVVVVSNNSRPTVDDYVRRLARLGIRVEPEEVISSATAAADYLLRQGVRGPVMVIGEEGLYQALREAGLTTVPAGPGAAGADVAAVVAGLDGRFDYAKLDAACQAIRRGARFVGTNPDVTVPAEGGRLQPGCGSLLAAIAACSGVQPVVVGKPHRPIMEMAIQRLAARGVTTTQAIVVVGDRLDTDVAAARAMGLSSALVLTGVSSREDVDRADAKPDWVFEDLAHLASVLMS
ncbi:HAD-IIA family hydrolase [Geochorda subterranea]|uniref:Acid sugar phosphatase n=1 Tax=Geochorda subterranea TaxID=3109564 RepID=A0ABZ1BPQ4_9FIRM|nr:HAD-IIA family hydrolase [Limnochorda sp. LNt]WRP14077.1 HAD-IIA family hydrolase [Limnochorda sp. LNt]